MPGLIETHPWGDTPLGARAQWPSALHSLVRLMLSAPQPMFVAWGPQQTLIYNDAFIPLLGRRHPECLGSPALQTGWADSRVLLEPFFKNVFDGSPVVIEDLKLDVDRGGGREPAHFRLSCIPVRERQGEVEGLFGVCIETTRDVVAREALENAVRALSHSRADARSSTERLELAMRAGAIVGSWVWEVWRDRFLPDEQFARTFGLDLEKSRAGLPLEGGLALIHPVDRERGRSAVEEALAQGGAFRSEYRILYPDGAYRWVEVSGRVEQDEDGGAVRMPGVLVDVDERKRAQEALIHSNTMLRTFVEAVPGVVYAKDRDGRLVVTNRQTAEMFGRSFKDVVGRTDLELLDIPAQAEAVMAIDRRIMESGVAERFEEQVSFGKEDLWWETTKAPLFDANGAVVGLIGSSVDITERRQAEDRNRELLQELNRRLKGALALAHDLARHSFDQPGDMDAALAEFEQRLSSLSKAHERLAATGWRSVSIAELIEDLTQGCPSQFALSGPAVELPPQVVVSLATALNELFANARRRGALSTADGKVSVDWSRSDVSWLRLSWRESGAPRVATPPGPDLRRRLIQQALTVDLHGEVDIRDEPGGLVCDMTTPL